MYKMGWHHHHGWHRHGWGGGFFFLPGLLLMGFLFFGLLKFLWPLLVIGLLVAFVSGGMRRGFGGYRREWRGDWSERWNRGWDGEKRKNDFDEYEKPKREERRYTRTIDGEEIEII